MIVSVIIRTYNEERYIGELLDKITKQEYFLENDVEIIIIDSGSEDRTLSIARQYTNHIFHISKSEFSFGRSLNIGCDIAAGSILVFISGHCVPTDDLWLTNLVSPIVDERVDYAYGRQVGRDTTKYSEYKIFEKFYKKESEIPQKKLFVNNANSAISERWWKRIKFDEFLPGLEDMDLAKKIISAGGKLGYVSDASVYHIHDESWSKIRSRYEREALALQSILPEIKFNFLDLVFYFFTSVIHDLESALSDNNLFGEIVSILRFRWMQYWGTYLGHRKHRFLSNRKKYDYFYVK